MTYDIVQKQVYCVGCRYSEIVTVRSTGSYGERDAALSLGFRELRIGISVGANGYHYVPKICVRCQNKLSRLDHLRLAILHHIGEYCRYSPVASTGLGKMFDGYTAAEVDAVAWKLIESGQMTVNDKGEVSCERQD